MASESPTHDSQIGRTDFLKLSSAEKEKVLKTLDELGVTVPVDKLDSLVDSVSTAIFAKFADKNESLFHELAESLGNQIGKRVAGKAGPFHVVSRCLDAWILCDSGTVWFNSKDRFRIEFASGLDLEFYFDADSDNDRWDFKAQGKTAMVEFGYPLGTRLLPLDIRLGEEQTSGLLVQAELSPVIVATKEPVVKLVYNIFRLSDEMDWSLTD